MVVSDITMSLDGFVAGPNPGPEHPLGEGGERLHEWAFALASFRERHGEKGGAKNANDDVVAESLRRTGAVVMGRRMFGGGEGPWDETWEGWWGDDPPFGVPVFVLTHHPRETLTKQGGTSFTFVTDGVESAVAQAREAAGDKDVLVAGGASAVQQSLNAGLVNELQVHIAPMLLRSGTRLFDNLGPEEIGIEKTRVIDSPLVTHLRFRVGK